MYVFRTLKINIVHNSYIVKKKFTKFVFFPKIIYMAFPERLEALLKVNKITQKELAEQLNIRRPSISDWKKDGTYPRLDIAIKIAQILGTTTEYLVTGKPPKDITEEEYDLVNNFRQLDHSGRKEIIKFVDFKLLEAKEEEKNQRYRVDDKKYGPEFEQFDTEEVYVKESSPVYLPSKSIPVREEVIDNVVFHEWGVIEIPLLGSTAAGQPIDFGDIDPVPLTRPWAASLIQGPADNYYCVTVRGESMTEADIKDGDHALLKHAEIPKNGEIMLVRHDNSSTLKRIKIVEGKDGEEVYICWEDGSKRRVKLNDDGYEIQGLLVAIERKPGKR